MEISIQSTINFGLVIHDPHSDSWLMFHWFIQFGIRGFKGSRPKGFYPNFLVFSPEPMTSWSLEPLFDYYFFE
jgi:hypothetical protein